MIVRTAKGLQVTSKTGKALSRPNLSRAEAEKRLREIEYYKAMAKRGKK